MTKAELIEAVATKAGGTLTKKAAGELVDALFGTLGTVIKKEKRFSYPGFGTFTVRNRKARKGRNPKSGAPITIKASKTVGFRPAKELKSSL
jgi:DNA-binding protein HU-beta